MILIPSVTQDRFSNNYASCCLRSVCSNLDSSSSFHVTDEDIHKDNDENDTDTLVSIPVSALVVPKSILIHADASLDTKKNRNRSRKKRSVTFHEIVTRRTMLDEPLTLDEKAQAWYTAKDLVAMRKQMMTYGNFIAALDSYDMDDLLQNEMDNNDNMDLERNNQDPKESDAIRDDEMICFRGMEIFIPGKRCVSTALRRRMLMDNIMSEQHQQMKQYHTLRYPERIRKTSLRISKKSSKFAHRIALRSCCYLLENHSNVEKATASITRMSLI
jgi:hypothetical protein